MGRTFQVAAVLGTPVSADRAGRVAAALKAGGAAAARDSSDEVVCAPMPEGLVIRFGVPAARLSDALTQTRRCLTGALELEGLSVDHLSALTLRTVTPPGV